MMMAVISHHLLCVNHEKVVFDEISRLLLNFGFSPSTQADELEYHKFEQKTEKDNKIT
jgi:hypothetical protein